MNITMVRPGMTFHYEGTKTEVRQVDTQICMNKTHINEKDCYENAVEVRVEGEL